MISLTITTLTAVLGFSTALPETVTEIIIPEGSVAKGCLASYDGNFQVAAVSVGKDFDEMQKYTICGEKMFLEMNLSNGILTDAMDRTGYIASNDQFQFDEPPQAGAIYTAGFSICDNQSLAMGSSTVWYQCLSGNFYNVYDLDWAEQCEPIHLLVMNCSATQTPAGGDLALPICQIGDGQIQAHTTLCVAPTAVPGATTYEVSSPVATPAESATMITTPSAEPSVPAGINTTVSTPTAPGEASSTAVQASSTPTSPESGAAHVSGSLGAFIIGVMGALFYL